MAYTTFEDFENYLEGFGTAYYGTKNSLTGSIVINTTRFMMDINNSYNKLNSILQTIDRIPNVPVGTNPKTGSHHPFLIEWNTIDTIYTKLKSRHILENSGALPEWMHEFGTRCNQIITGIYAGNISVYTDVTNSNIGYPIKINGAGIATMHSNWNTGFLNGVEYESVWRILVSDYTDGSNIGQAKFLVSGDDGYSYGSISIITGTNWIQIGNGLEVRFSPGLGTLDQFSSYDTWSLTLKPQNGNKINRNVQFRTYGIG